MESLRDKLAREALRGDRELTKRTKWAILPVVLIVVLLLPIGVTVRASMIALAVAVVLHWLSARILPESRWRLAWDYVLLIYDAFLASLIFYVFHERFPAVFALYFLAILAGAWVRKSEGSCLVATLAIISYNTIMFLSAGHIQVLENLALSLLFGLAALGTGALSQQEEQAKEALETERERARVRAERIGALEVGRVITSTLDLEQVLQLIMQRINKTLDAEAGSILLVEGDALVFRVALGEMGEAVRPFKLKMGQGIAGWVAAEGRPLLVPHAEDDPRFYAHIDELTHFHTRSILCVPMKLRSRVIGVIQVINKQSGDFVEDDLYWLSMVASSAAVAIEKAQLYEQTQAQVVMLEEANQELRETQQQLVESAKLASIGQLAAGVAHEINNPLSIILGFAETIPKLVELDPVVRKPLDTIQREALRCRRIVKNLLDFASQSKLSLAPVNLNVLLDHTIPLLEYQVSVQDIKIRKEYSPELPSVMADVDRLQQVFVNLILNAAQAMPDGGELVLRTSAQDGSVVVEFGDTGIGIPEENLDRIFEPFFSTKEVGEGTGLGLSVSYGIIEQHDGTIQVTSEVGVGSTFTITLPVSESKQDSSPPA